MTTSIKQKFFNRIDELIEIQKTYEWERDSVPCSFNLKTVQNIKNIIEGLSDSILEILNKYSDLNPNPHATFQWTCYKNTNKELDLEIGKNKITTYQGDMFNCFLINEYTIKELINLITSFYIPEDK